MRGCSRGYGKTVGVWVGQVRIMKEWDPSGKQGPRQPMPDLVTVLQPKEEEPISDKPLIGAPLRTTCSTLSCNGCAVMLAGCVVATGQSAGFCPSSLPFNHAH